ncbi:MAG: hypothetical protein WD772_04455 [Pseudohongiellaceae bacterium]
MPSFTLPQSYLSYLFRAILWTLLCWFVSTRMAAGQFWQVLLAIGILSLPLTLAFIHDASMRKILRRQKLLQQGFLFRLFSGRLLIVLAALFYGWTAGIFLLLRLHAFTLSEWLLFGSVVPLYLIIFHWLRQRLAAEYKPWLLDAEAMGWARLLCPSLLALSGLIVALWQQNSPSLITLNEAIAQQQALVANLHGSRALETLAGYMQILQGLKLFFLSQLGSGNAWLVLLAITLETWLIAWLACTALSCLLLNRNAWRRSFGPLNDVEQVPPLPAGSLVSVSLFSTFILLFVFIPSFSYVELWVLQRPVVSESPARFALRLEKIGEEYYQPGTLEALQLAEREALVAVNASVGNLQQQTDAAFAALENNVDAYLDWYYSLGGEYGRLLSLATGNLEVYMARKLTEILQQGDVFAGVQTALREAMTGHAEAQRQYQLAAESILAGNRVDPGDYPVETVATAQSYDFVQLPRHDDVVGLQNRLLTSSGTGAVAGVMTSVMVTKLMTNIVAKGSFKLAAKSMAKVLVTKTAGGSLGAGAGAATGAVIGSVVPGIGTVIGAVVGGIAGGIAVGIGIDKVLIELEEEISRETFRAEILAAIDEARQEF